jgi:hypothetical protein
MTAIPCFVRNCWVRTEVRRHRSRTRLQINACENCPRPPRYVHLAR